MSALLWIISAVVLAGLVLLAIWDCRRAFRWARTATPEQLARATWRANLMYLAAMAVTLLASVTTLVAFLRGVPQTMPKPTIQQPPKAKSQSPPKQPISYDETGALEGDNVRNSQK